jgi:hypothetical protein
LSSVLSMPAPAQRKVLPISSVEKYQSAMDNADQELERSDEPVCDHL